MEFLDARRLTGPSLLFDDPGSVLDVKCSDEEASRLVPAWEKQIRRMLAELGWEEGELESVRLEGGVSLGFTAPIDALYAASEINEWAWAACDHELNAAQEPDFDATLAAIRASLAEEANASLIQLEKAAAEHDVAMLWDDDEVSLGLGRHSETWPVRALPEPASLDWGGYRDVPLGLVTGTNGKTTCVRIAAHILRTAGHRVGMSSTDWISVDERIIDRDDWSGPGGARNVLRERDVDAAILETARGGLLRRGLGVARADAALITNIARDHLGDFGSRNLEELSNIKWVVSRALRDGGVLVLNAENSHLTARAASYDGEIVWFSYSPENKIIDEHLRGGRVAFFVDGSTDNKVNAKIDGKLVRAEGKRREVICSEAEIPITMGGAAQYNVANALAAAALTSSLGVSLDDIRKGLMSMAQDNNPGRCNIYELDGITVIVDFAHNPEALRAIIDMAGRMSAERKALCFGQAGDRPDELIRELARDAWTSCTGLDRVMVSELAKYRRGRGEGEVFALIRDEVMIHGARPEQVEHHAEEIESLDAALAWAKPGDLIIMLALERSPEIYERLQNYRSG